MIKISKFFIRNWLILTLIGLGILASVVALRSISFLRQNNHFVLLANALVEGRLHLVSPPPWLNDLAFFKNKYYVPFGPLPAILLIPFAIIFGSNFSQQILAFMAAPLNFILLYRVSRTLGVKKEKDALWLSTFFIFGSIYLFLTLVNISAYLAQIIAITFLILGLNEYLHSKRWFIIGMYVGLAGITRPTLYLSAIFFLLEIAIDKRATPKKGYSFLLFLTPILISLLFSGVYNHARFGNFLDNGYDRNISHGEDLIKARQEGFFSLAHVPGNIYFLLLKGPEPIRKDNISYVLRKPYLKMDHWGLGILFSSPLFLYLILLDPKKKYVISSLITTVFMLIPILTFYTYGAWQYGFRHALDFYPFLFIILLSIFKDHLPLRAKILICYSIFFNLYYMFSIWGIYPFAILP